MAVNQILLIDPLEGLLNVIAELQAEKVKTADKDTLAQLTVANNNTFWILSCLAQRGKAWALKLHLYRAFSNYPRK
jgi:hypothetical protein